MSLYVALGNSLRYLSPQQANMSSGSMDNCIDNINVASTSYINIDKYHITLGYRIHYKHMKTTMDLSDLFNVEIYF